MLKFITNLCQISRLVRLIKNTQRGSAFLLLAFLFIWLIPVSGQAKTLKIGLNNWCPHVCIPSTGEPKKGYTSDILIRILTRAGYEIETVEAPFQRLLFYAEQGKLDILGSIYKAEAPFMTFAKTPTGMAEELFFVGKDNGWRYQGIASLKDIGLIALINGADYNSKELTDYISANPVQFIELAGTNIVLRQILMIASKRIDSFIGDKSVVRYFASRVGEQGQIKEANALSSRNYLYTGISPKTAEASKLTKIINEGMIYLRETGELEEIMATYGLEDWKE